MRTGPRPRLMANGLRRRPTAVWASPGKPQPVKAAVVATGLWAAFFHPWLWFVLLALFLLLALWLMPKLWRGMRWLFRKFST